MTEVPKTFHDAIIITRRLGFRYLWIDCLCIIQDSINDWKAESARMGTYFRCSDLTIAASDSVNAHSGCFRNRAGLLVRPCKIWARGPADLNGNPKPTYAFGDGGSESIGNNTLSGRAWVSQESLLAPRTLLFDSNGIAWKCLTTECSENHLQGGERNTVPARH